MKRSGREADSLTMSARTMVCGRANADPALGAVAGGLEASFLNIVFDRMRQALPRLGLSPNAAGDSSGSRFRHLKDGQGPCSGDNLILVTVNLAPGPAGTGEPPAGRPAILPYALSVVAEQGGRRWTRRIDRSRHEAHEGVTNDPRTRSPIAATRASVVHDLTETGNQLAQSLKGTE